MKEPAPARSPSRPRVILHVDMDAFFASVEQLDHPEWRGRPVVVGSPPHQRGVVAAASYEARAFGIHSAMPSREAGRRCPHAVFAPVNGRRYSEVSAQVRGILERFSPDVEMVSIDEAFLDVTGSAALFGDGPAIAARIRAAIRAETGLTASVGVAANKFLAKLASDMNKPDGLTLVPRGAAEVAAFLAPLPVGRLWGVGAVTRRHFEAAGIRTIGDIQRMDATRLAALAGADAAAHFKRLARGEDEREVETESGEKTLSREYTFLYDCEDRETIRAVLDDLVEDVGRRLREAGHYAGLGRLKLRWKGFETLTRQRPFDRPACDDFSLRQMAESLLAAEPLVKPVRLIGFGVSHLVDHPAQQLSLFERGARAVERRERLSHTVDRIRDQLGQEKIQRAAAVGRKRADSRD